MSKILISGIDIPSDGNETIIRIQPDGSVRDIHGIDLECVAVDVGALSDEEIESRNQKVSRIIQDLKWKDVFANLVRVAIDKGYCPDEVRQNPTDFEESFREFFGRSANLFEV